MNTKRLVFLLLLVSLCMYAANCLAAIPGVYKDATKDDGHEHKALCTAPGVCSICGASVEKDGIEISSSVGHLGDYVQFTYATKETHILTCNACGLTFREEQHGTFCDEDQDICYYCKASVSKDGIIMGRVAHTIDFYEDPSKIVPYDAETHISGKCIHCGMEARYDHVFENGICSVCGYRQQQENIKVSGDITGNGSADVMDVIRLLKYVSGWNVTVNESACDVTGDGAVNIMDVIRLLKYVSGWNVNIY